MNVDSRKPLTARQVGALLEQLEQAAEREACWSCACLQGFISRLEQEASADARALLEMYEVRPERRHGGLGCQPCPPADVFTTYSKT